MVTQTLESININPKYEYINIYTAQMGTMLAMADTGATLNAIDETVAAKYPRQNIEKSDTH